MDIRNCDGIDLLNTIQDGSVDLFLTDPPYIISRESGMNKLRDAIDSDQDLSKTEDEWKVFLEKNKDVKMAKNAKENFLKYGTIYGKKYAVKTKYGQWDEDFTLGKLEEFIELFYKKLKPGGTCIVWFDIEKISYLIDMMKKNKLQQFRWLVWVKNNPQPINSKINYLSNAKEIAVSFVKKNKATYNSSYNKGVYFYPTAAGKNRFHPTQKSLPLFEELIKEHTNEGDLVVDTFLGGGTTAVAAKRTGRRFIGSEIDPEFFKLLKNVVDNEGT